MLRVIITTALIAGAIVTLVAAYWIAALLGIYLGIATALYPPLIWFDYALVAFYIFGLIKLWRL